MAAHRDRYAIVGMSPLARDRDGSPIDVMPFALLLLLRLRSNSRTV